MTMFFPFHIHLIEGNDFKTDLKLKSKAKQIHPFS